jgi:hypothetical protein
MSPDNHENEICISVEPAILTPLTPTDYLYTDTPSFADASDVARFFTDNIFV